MKNFAGFKNAKALITGGLGFIGSNLARCLAEGGARVTIIDSLIKEHGGNLFNFLSWRPAEITILLEAESMPARRICFHVGFLPQEFSNVYLI